MLYSLISDEGDVRSEFSGKAKSANDILFQTYRALVCGGDSCRSYESRHFSMTASRSGSVLEEHHVHHELSDSWQAEMFLRDFCKHGAVKLCCSIPVGSASAAVAGAEKCENITFTHGERRSWASPAGSEVFDSGDCIVGTVVTTWRVRSAMQMQKSRLVSGGEVQSLLFGFVVGRIWNGLACDASWVPLSCSASGPIDAVRVFQPNLMAGRCECACL
jgi:hypothetical protein